METRKSYLKASNYNMVRVHDAVIEVAKNAGAKIVKEKYKTEKITFYNRSISEKIERNNSIIEALEKHGKNADHLKQENETLQAAFENSAYTTLESKYCWGGLSFKFVLGGFLYEYSQDDNPFFPSCIRKIKVDESGSYTGDFYCDSFENHPYFSDDIFSINATPENIQEIANSLFDFILENAKAASEVIEKQKKRVPNYYNSGYHYETITKRNTKKTVLEFA